MCIRRVQQLSLTHGQLGHCDHIAVAMSNIGFHGLPWGREIGRDWEGAGEDGTVVTTSSSMTVQKSNLSGRME